MSAKKGEFQNAIRVSLKNLIDLGEPFTKNDVIDNATYSDGIKVGKTTLYSKSRKTGSYTHEDLLTEIERAVKASLRQKSTSKKQITIERLRDKVRGLEVENGLLIDQLVEMEAKRVENNSKIDRERLKLFTQEKDQYVLSKLIDRLTNSYFDQVTKFITLFEEKYARDKRLLIAQDEFRMLIEEFDRYKLIGLSDIIGTHEKL